jgi:hypothetical protein
MRVWFFLLRQDGVMRGSKLVALKQILDGALQLVAQADRGGGGGSAPPTVHTCLVLKRLGSPECAATHAMVLGRDVWWADAVAAQPAEAATAWLDAEAPCFVLYTSGSTGKPKGILHTTVGGQAASERESKEAAVLGGFAGAPLLFIATWASAPSPSLQSLPLSLVRSFFLSLSLFLLRDQLLAPFPRSFGPLASLARRLPRCSTREGTCSAQPRPSSTRLTPPKATCTFAPRTAAG